MTKRNALCLLFCLPAWMVHHQAIAEDPSAHSDSGPSEIDEEFQHPPGLERSAELDELMSDLGDVVYTTRKQATERLIEIGVPALAHLRHAYRYSGDLEVRLRIEDTVLTIFLDYHVYNRHGFLGVSLIAYNRDDPNHAGPLVPEGAAGVFLTAITEKTAAERAGLKKKDVIVAIDGEPCEGGAAALPNYVAGKVRAHRPGTSMALTVIRKDQTLEIEVILGRVSPEQMRRSRIIAIPELLQEAKAGFPDWWLRNFRATRLKQPGERGS